MHDISRNIVLFEDRAESTDLGRRPREIMLALGSGTCFDLVLELSIQSPRAMGIGEPFHHRLDTGRLRSVRARRGREPAVRGSGSAGLAESSEPWVERSPQGHPGCAGHLGVAVAHTGAREHHWSGRHDRAHGDREPGGSSPFRARRLNGLPHRAGSADQRRAARPGAASCRWRWSISATAPRSLCATGRAGGLGCQVRLAPATASSVCCDGECGPLFRCFLIWSIARDS